MLCKIKVANISRHQRVLKSNKMKIYFFKDFFKLSSFFSNLIMPLLFCSISSISITGNSLNAEYLYEELKIVRLKQMGVQASLLIHLKLWR